MKKRTKKKSVRIYKSPESRARQLAGLSGVKIKDHVPECADMEKINGKGTLAGVSEDVRKDVIEQLLAGVGMVAIGKKHQIGTYTVQVIRDAYIDENSGFRHAMFKETAKEKFRKIVELATDRMVEVAPEMSAKDATFAATIAMENLLKLERDVVPNTVNNTVNIGSVDINTLKDMFNVAKTLQDAKDIIEGETE
jgi:hypothetical protein